MAASRENNDVNGSPNTSEGIESLRGTPATKLTPFSPDNNTGDVKHGAFGINRFRVPPAFILSHPNSRFNSRDNVGASSAPGSSDPFITTSHLTATTRATDSSKLSPTACLFTPAIGTDSVSSNGASSGFGSAAIKANDAPSLGSSPQSAKIHNNGTLAFNAPLSSPYSSKSNTVGKNAIVLVPSGINVSPASFQQGSPMKSALTKAGIVDATFVKFKTFSMDDGTSRALKVSNIAPDTPMGDLDAFFDVSVVTFHA